MCLGVAVRPRRTSSRIAASRSAGPRWTSIVYVSATSVQPRGQARNCMPDPGIALAAPAAVATAAVTVTRRALLARRRRGVLGHHDPHDVAAVEHLSRRLEPVALGQDPAHVQQAVDALSELDERAEVGDLDDLAGVLVTDLDLLGHRLDRLAR